MHCKTAESYRAAIMSFNGVVAWCATAWRGVACRAHSSSPKNRPLSNCSNTECCLHFRVVFFVFRIENPCRTQNMTHMHNMVACRDCRHGLLAKRDGPTPADPDERLWRGGPGVLARLWVHTRPIRPQRFSSCLTTNGSGGVYPCTYTKASDRKYMSCAYYVFKVSPPIS